MTATPVQSYEFRAEIQQLLHILVHALYTDREIFLRELISNASDALNRVRFEQLTNPNILDAEAELAIRLKVDSEAKTLTISDSGIGMNRDEIIQNLGTIAHSGAMAFLKALRERGGQPNTDIIGQFGVGFYSVFMVADKVEVISRSFRPEDTAVKWTSDGSNAYTVEEADKAERGTQIIVHFKEDATDLLNDTTIQRIIQRHSNYVAFPIYVGDKLANAQTAIWRRAPREVTEKEYHDFYNQLTFDFNKPLLYIHQAADAPVQFFSLIFIPGKFDRGAFRDNRDGKVRLYARKVLIQEESKDLLPEWLRFVEAIIDSEDLPLNISRETVQSNRLMQGLKTRVVSKIISELETLAEKSPEKYQQFWREFGRFIKEGVVTDAANKDRLIPLLRFHTSRNPNGLTSLPEYVANMVANQTDIYYLLGDDPIAIQHSPHLDVFKARKVEALLLTDPIDSFLINAIGIYNEKKLHNGADAELKLPESADDTAEAAEALTADASNTLIERFREVLGDRVTDVRTTLLLRDSAARLVSPDQGFGADMERVYRLLNQQMEVPKRILEINPRHPLIRNLSEVQDSELATQIIEQIFESALLVEGIHPRPVDMVARIQAIMEAATRK